MLLNVTKFTKVLLTHQLTPAGPLPAVLDPDGVYPYQSYCETSSRPILKKYEFIKLENAFLKILICPDLGGKVYSIIHKESEKEILYVPDVIRPSRILPRFSFVAGGIEVSFPISHTPSQNEKVSKEIVEEKDRIYVSVGETEIKYGMQWTVEYSLGINDRFLTQRTVFHNPTNKSHPWMSWSNAAIPAFDDTEFYFPKGKVLLHSDELRTIDWGHDGPNTNADIKHMSGFFWQNPDINVFGCYSPSKQIGLYHVAERAQMPGIKLWSYGNGRDVNWSYLSSLKKQSYLEIQAGPIIDQSIKHELGSNATHHHSEYWFPTDETKDIYQMELPNIKLRAIDDVPLFSYARAKEIIIWEQLIQTYQTHDVEKMPLAPSPEMVHWPPTSMYKLEPALEWAIGKSDEKIKSFWQLYLGVYWLGSENVEKAIPLLLSSGMDMANAVLGRVYLYLQNPKEALKHYAQIKEKSLRQHPQVVVEQDKALEALGKTMIPERLDRLTQLNALEDEWIIERRISLLIDIGNYGDAKKILQHTKFQKIHQRYERKKLWEKLCTAMNTPMPYPESLGEDNLAQFGAYRSFEEE